MLEGAGGGKNPESTIGEQFEENFTPDQTRRKGVLSSRTVSSYCKTVTSYSYTKNSKNIQEIMKDKEELNEEMQNTEYGAAQTEQIPFSISGATRVKRSDYERESDIEDIMDKVDGPTRKLEKNAYASPENEKSQDLMEGDASGSNGFDKERHLLLNEVANGINGIILEKKYEGNENHVNEENDSLDKVEESEEGTVYVGLQPYIEEVREETESLKSKTENTEDEIRNEILDTVQNIGASRQNKSNAELKPCIKEVLNEMEDVTTQTETNEEEKSEDGMAEYMSKPKVTIRQNKEDEGRKNALLFVVIVTSIAILIQSLYNLIVVS